MSKQPAVAIRQRPNYVEENLELVKPIALSVIRRLPPSFELDDLIQAGHMGLLDAAAKYNSKMNVPFRFYASIRIRGAILDTCTRRHYRNSTHAEMEAACYEVPSKVEAIDVGIHRKQMATKLKAALALLTPEDQKVITLYFARNDKLSVIGKRLGVCEMRASQLVKTAKEHLRERLAWQGVKAA
jgi:RNA polymerase sigma factor (sigma-70 family)